KASDIIQELVDDHPANTMYQDNLANLQINIGMALDRQKRWPEAFTALEKGLVLRQKLARAEPKNALYSRALGASHAARGRGRGPPRAAGRARRRPAQGHRTVCQGPAPAQRLPVRPVAGAGAAGRAGR